MYRTVLNWYVISLVICSIIVVGGCSEKPRAMDERTQNTPLTPIKPLIIRTFRHDSTAFTQGLFYYNDKLFESDGLYGESSIRIVDTNGVVLKSNQINQQFFAEGCALFNGNIFKLTWREEVCFIYSPELTLMGTYRYSGEGWGLTSDSISFYMSDGSDTLYERDTRFNVSKKIPVTIQGNALSKLNELEFAKGSIYANVWYSDFIFRISKETGRVLSVIDCSELVSIENPSNPECVLNGIAYDKERDLFYITGKKWKNVFVVKIPE